MPLRGKPRPFNDDTAEMSPAEPGAYELLYKETVVYIGSSGTSVQSRLRSHRKQKKFAKVTHFRYRIVDWPEDAEDLETDLCDTFKRQNGGRLPRLQQRAPKRPESLLDW